MSTDQDLEQLMTEKAAAPQTVSGDAGSVTQRPLRELIELDRYLAEKRAARSPGLPIILRKLSPPGTVS